MTQASQVECTFYIPQRRDSGLSDGQPHDLETWEWLRDELYAAFKGATQAPGSYRGFWEDPDTKQRVTDLSRKLIVAVSPDKTNRLREILAAACVRFQQKVIYLSVAGQVEFVKADSNDEKDESVS